jgi:hypothetical protein
MYIQTAEPEYLDSPTDPADTLKPIAIRDSWEAEERLRPARGIVTAVLLSMPFWALIGFTVYLLT